jgi:hypothetical protein
MTNSITPPPELVQQWLWSDDYSLGPLITITSNRLQNVATQAAQWGADMELEACCKWTAIVGGAEALRATRRPQPPSLKELALNDLDTIQTHDSFGFQIIDLSNIRRALEALDD